MLFIMLTPDSLIKRRRDTLLPALNKIKFLSTQMTTTFNNSYALFLQNTLALTCFLLVAENTNKNIKTKIKHQIKTTFAELKKNLKQSIRPEL